MFIETQCIKLKHEFALGYFIQHFRTLLNKNQGKLKETCKEGGGVMDLQGGEVGPKGGDEDYSAGGI